VTRLVAAPDKFRGTATATEAARSICAAATSRGLECVAVPMSDGGEGFVEALGGTLHTAAVTGPLGTRVEATWSMLDDGTAIVEAAQAAGRALVPAPSGDDPLAASTWGVGELVADAIAAGARRVVVGCGGTASTDGGLGCLRALERAVGAASVPLVAACDVAVAFADAALVYAPQKGATPDQVDLLAARLARLAEDYAGRFGVDVRDVPGAGAAGGLAGGLRAFGATIVGGASFVAERRGLIAALGDADLVVTGEGSFDDQTLSGKVVDLVLSLRGDLAALVVAGRADTSTIDALRARRRGPVDLVVLDPAHQLELGTPKAIEEAVSAYLGSR